MKERKVDVIIAGIFDVNIEDIDIIGAIIANISVNIEDIATNIGADIA